jgi:peptidoglycan/LPS O-acetylase OafA/YrhL
LPKVFRLSKTGDAKPPREGVLYLPVFDGFRGFAVLAVALSHIAFYSQWEPSPEFLQALRRASFFSPEFLFVVSGFVLFLPIAFRGRLVSASAYAIRRIARIVPAYLLSLTVTLLFATVIGHPPLPMSTVEAFLVHLVFLQHPLGVSGFLFNQVYWTLSILAAFYVLLPFVASRYVRHPLIGLFIAISIVVVWRVSMSDRLAYADFITFPLFAADFAIGMTAAWAYIKLRNRFNSVRLARPAFIALALAAVATVLLMYVIGLERVRGDIYFFGESPLLAIAAPLSFGAVMVAMSLGPRLAQWPLSNRFARWIGRVSYGVFLYHILVIQILLRGFGFQPDGTFASFLAVSAFVLPISLLVGWLSFTFLEEPVRRRAREWTRSRRPSHETSRAGVRKTGAPRPA